MIDGINGCMISDIYTLLLLLENQRSIDESDRTFDRDWSYEIVAQEQRLEESNRLHIV